MRLSNATRYPHPVLSPFTNDYSSGEFSVEFDVSENPETGDLTLWHKITLTEESMLDLVNNGKVEVGCIVRCMDTYYVRLHPFAFPTGRTDFPAGDLINTVNLRPIIWVKEEMPGLASENIHPEFGGVIPLKDGDIVAMDVDFDISVGLAKLAKAESIFELKMSDDVPEGTVKVDVEHERISLFMGPKTFEFTNKLRNSSYGSPVVMNSVYLPAVMEVLDLLRKDQESYADRRWYKPFVEKCVFKGVQLSGEFSLIAAAQMLLETPLASLEDLVQEDENDK